MKRPSEVSYLKLESIKSILESIKSILDTREYQIDENTYAKGVYSKCVHMRTRGRGLKNRS